MICSMLPVSSQACLALTCKTYYTQFKSVFRDEFFDSPDPDSEPLGPWNDDKVKPDWKLFRKFIAERELERGFFLTQAQTIYWRFCQVVANSTQNTSLKTRLSMKRMKTDIANGLGLSYSVLEYNPSNRSQMSCMMQIAVFPGNVHAIYRSLDSIALHG
jgi:hypothetical protein